MSVNEDNLALAKLLDRLSPEDRRATRDDLIAYGNMVVEETPDGGARRVPPSEWATRLPEAKR